MISRIRDKVGPAGLILGVLALVVALSGAAIAAGGLTRQQEKQVKKIAKKFAGKNGKNGAAGPAGPAGAPGAKGDKGDTGATGAAGSAGASGVSPTGTNFTGSKTAGGTTCTEGGVEIKGASTNLVCNGKKGTDGQAGSPWTAGGTLPAKATQTGTYSLTSASGVGTLFGEFEAGDISFSIPLAAELDESHAKVVTSTVPAECENTEHAGTASFQNPEADPGYLCVYQTEAVEMSEPAVYLPTFTPPGPAGGAGVAGAFIAYKVEGTAARAGGTWAVTGAVPGP